MVYTTLSCKDSHICTKQFCILTQETFAKLEINKNNNRSITHRKNEQKSYLMTTVHGLHVDLESRIVTLIERKRFVMSTKESEAHNITRR